MTKNTKQWYHKYTQLPSHHFSYENHGDRTENINALYYIVNDDDYNIVDIKQIINIDDVQIIGYTEHPPFKNKHDEQPIAIMFEQKKTFEKWWWHYPKDYNYGKVEQPTHKLQSPLTRPQKQL